jgi:transcriptional regulator with XRE-family HTH domain
MTKKRGLDLKIARTRAGMKQYELASRLGVRQSHLSDAEADRRRLPRGLYAEALRIIREYRVRQEATEAGPEPKVDPSV